MYLRLVNFSSCHLSAPWSVLLLAPLPSFSFLLETFLFTSYIISCLYNHPPLPSLYLCCCLYLLTPPPCPPSLFLPSLFLSHTLCSFSFAGGGQRADRKHPSPRLFAFASSSVGVPKTYLSDRSSQLLMNHLTSPTCACRAHTHTRTYTDTQTHIAFLLFENLIEGESDTSGAVISTVASQWFESD